MKISSKVTTQRALVAIALATLISSCQNRNSSSAPVVTDDNLVVSGNPATNQTIGETSQKFQVLGTEAFRQLVKSGQIRLPSSIEGKSQLKTLAEETVPAPQKPGSETPPAAEASLKVAFPTSLLGEHQIFGGVITAVSDKDSENLGMLKLTDLSPLHVRPIIAKVSETEFAMALMGCVRNCSEGSAQEPLILIPVSGVNQDGSSVVLDLAPLGNSLNLIQMLDPLGETTKLKTKLSKTVSVDYSLSTLVFDVQVTMIPLDADPQATDVKETNFTVRWYMRLGSGFNPAFESRPATDGVGFFMTERSANPKITRFSKFVMEGLGASPAPVHYFIKHVPEAYQAPFKASFEAWNQKFVEMMGHPLLSYEFIPEGDPRNELLVAGDIRYNIIEWDLKNQAPYGGLGPSIANQFTGETMSANILIQGPKIVEIYTKWFEIAKQAEALRAQSENAAADQLLAEGFRSLKAQVISPRTEKPFSLSIGKLAFRVTSQLPELSDPLFSREEFEIIPPGVTYETYMAGYFQEMVSHEMGHNIGLRHNFRGNLSAKPGLVLGQVSHSIMEYLNRGFRHLNRIGEYDTMAIKYGYTGTQPEKLGLFCTDENVATNENTGSPECSRDDATNDPYGYFLSRFKRATDLLVARGLTASPAWTVDEMAAQLEPAVKGLGFYAARSQQPGIVLTNFFGIEDRPQTLAEVKAYTIRKFKDRLCDPTFAEVIAMKESEEAKAKTIANIKALQEKVVGLLTPMKASEAIDLQCGT